MTPTCAKCGGPIRKIYLLTSEVDERAAGLTCGVDTSATPNNPWMTLSALRHQQRGSGNFTPMRVERQQWMEQANGNDEFWLVGWSQDLDPSGLFYTEKFRIRQITVGKGYTESEYSYEDTQDNWRLWKS